MIKKYRTIIHWVSHKRHPCLFKHNNKHGQNTAGRNERYGPSTIDLWQNLNLDDIRNY